MLSRKLVGLLDMVIKLDGHEVAYAYGYLANAYGISTNEPTTRYLDPDQKIILAEALKQTEVVCKPDRLDLPATLSHIPRVRQALTNASSYGDVQAPLGELRTRMHDELKSRLFLFVPPIEASYYNRKEAFGETVARKFGRATTDIESAGDGIALGMYTASVFHLMRVVEYGLQRLGRKLRIRFAGEKNWQNILDEVNKAIRTLPDNTAKTKARKSEFSAIAAHLFNVKLAWRNPVMHPKASYSPEEATEVYGHVRTFMNALAQLV